MQDFPGADPVPDFATSPGTDDGGDGTGATPRLSVTWDRQSSLASSPSCSDAESSEFDYGGHPPQSELEEIPSPLWLSPLRPRWPPIHQPQSLEIRREVNLSGIMRTLVANMLKKMEKGYKGNAINIPKHNSEATVDAGIPKMSRAIFDNIGCLTMLSFHQPKMKMILKLDLHDNKAVRKAMKAVVTLSDIDSIAVDMKDKKMTVIGLADPVDIVLKLRKFWHTELLSIGPAKQPKKEEAKKDLSVLTFLFGTPRHRLRHRRYQEPENDGDRGDGRSGSGEEGAESLARGARSPSTPPCGAPRRRNPRKEDKYKEANKQGRQVRRDV